MKLKHLKTLDVYAKPITVQILSPETDTHEGLEIDVYGDDSAQGQAAADAVARETIALMNKKGKDAAMAPARAKTKAIDVLVACTVGWRDASPGADIGPFSPEAARQLYLDYPWIAEQVMDARADKTRFFGKPSPG